MKNKDISSNHLVFICWPQTKTQIRNPQLLHIMARNVPYWIMCFFPFTSKGNAIWRTQFGPIIIPSMCQWTIFYIMTKPAFINMPKNNLGLNLKRDEPEEANSMIPHPLERPFSFLKRSTLMTSPTCWTNKSCIWRQCFKMFSPCQEPLT